MPDFDYIARELSGKQVTGTLTATSEKDALSVLQSKSLFPMSIGMSEETRKQVEKLWQKLKKIQSERKKRGA